MCRIVAQHSCYLWAPNLAYLQDNVQYLLSQTLSALLKSQALSHFKNWIMVENKHASN